MKTISKAVALTLILGASGAQAATFFPESGFYDITPGGALGPTDPTEPTDPTGPTDPTEPTEPTSPTDPTEPTNPTGPNEPIGSTGGVIPQTGVQLEQFFFAAPAAQSFEGFVPSTPSTPPAVVPLPPSAWLFGTALFGLLSIARQRRA